MAYLNYLLLIAIASAVRSEYTNQEGKSTIVLVAPSIWDEHYGSKFYALINFQIEYARMIMGNDNVVILADKYTLPYLDGRSNKVKKKLPRDILISASIYDVNIQDYAPFGLRRMIKFGYMPRDMNSMAARQIEKSLERFMAVHDILVDKRENSLALCGGDVSDNGVDAAIINRQVIADNEDRLPDWAVMIKLLNAFKTVAMIDMPINSTMSNGNMTTRLTDLMSFIDEKMLVMSALEEGDFDRIDSSLWKKYRHRFKLLQIPSHFTGDQWGDRDGVCGIYSSIVSTDRSLYVPVFGNDPANWNMGHSTQMDKMILNQIQVNSLKKVIPINMPKAVCEMGTSLKSLSWKLTGELADRMVSLARWHGHRRRA